VYSDKKAGCSLDDFPDPKIIEPDKPVDPDPVVPPNPFPPTDGDGGNNNNAPTSAMYTSTAAASCLVGLVYIFI